MGLAAIGTGGILLKTELVLLVFSACLHPIGYVQTALPEVGKMYIPQPGNMAEMVMTYQWRSQLTSASHHIHSMMTPLQTWLTFLSAIALKPLFGKTHNSITLTFLLPTILPTLKLVFTTL